MCSNLFHPQGLIIGLTACAGLLVPFSACAQNAQDEAALAALVVPEPRTIVAALPEKAPERVVELISFDEAEHICIDTYKLSLSRTVMVRNTPVTARGRISRQCDGKGRSAPVPESAVMTTRSGGKSGPTDSLKPESPSFAFTVSFPYAGNWQVTVVSKFAGEETTTVSVPVKVLAEPPVREPTPDSEPPDEV